MKGIDGRIWVLEEGLGDGQAEEEGLECGHRVGVAMNSDIQ